VAPPNVEANPTRNTPVQGFGLHVPAIIISPFARAGTIDHQLLSFGSYATFVENIFLNGARLDPAALGNPDRRPTIRDALTSASFVDGHREPIGDLSRKLDFTQTPLPPFLLPTHIPSGTTVSCGRNVGANCTQNTVTITWNPVGNPASPARVTYHIQLDDAGLPQCVGSAATCTDTPGSGVHLYRAFPWTRAAAQARCRPQRRPTSPDAGPCWVGGQHSLARFQADAVGPGVIYSDTQLPDSPP
jgi:Phosphoesterase family